jgi:CBS domain containing-hemolysin-like protein
MPMGNQYTLSAVVKQNQRTRGVKTVGSTVGFLVSLAFAALPLYHLWWFDIVAHFVVVSIMTVWLLTIVPRYIAIPTVYSTLIVWELFEYYILAWQAIGYEDTLLDLLVGIIAVSIVLIVKSYI